MDNILKGNFGNTSGLPGHRQVQLPFDIKFGEAQQSVLCQNCKTMRRAGFFVIWKNVVVLICVQCTAGAIMKYQDTHIGGEKIFQVDAEVPPDVVSKISEELVKENRDLPEDRVAKIVDEAIKRI